MSRALATVQEVSEISPIPDADAIEVATVKGWKVVTGKNEFKPGDLCVYFEIDSYLDTTDPRFSFLSPRGERVDPHGSDFKGHVLKTVKLRKQLSQGLLIPLDKFPEAEGWDIGDDITDIIGIRKWDPPIPAALAGEVKGPRPSWVPKTDAERVQNIDFIKSLATRDGWVCSEKLDGSSFSYYHYEGEGIGACSRNLELKITEKTPWQVANDQNIFSLLSGLSYSYNAKVVVAQGEMVGPGIQGNGLKLKAVEWRCFRILVDGVDLHPDKWGDGWNTVPFLDEPLPKTIEECLTVAELPTKIKGARKEGVVWRYYGDQDLVVKCVKAISNKFLLKQKD